jgi:hypothetical protein
MIQGFTIISAWKRAHKWNRSLFLTKSANLMSSQLPVEVYEII